MAKGKLSGPYSTPDATTMASTVAAWELGIPPLGYLQFLKMERAKTLLRDGMSVRQTGVEIGMPDPYHFSKQFKHIVGMSPTAYLKHVGTEERRTRVGNSEM